MENETAKIIDVARQESINRCFLNMILNAKFRRNFPSKHKRHLGEKDKVRLELRLFNGQPQAIVWYGKTQYSFDVHLTKIEEQEARLLRKITGHDGIREAVHKLPVIQKLVKADKLEARTKELKERGF